jgi:hypothetical protein
MIELVIEIIFSVTVVGFLIFGIIATGRRDGMRTGK